MQTVFAVCSNKPRPQVQNNYRDGRGWEKDAFHAAKDEKVTFCGRDRTSWLTIDKSMPIADALSDFHFCIRCANKIRKDTP